MIIIRVLTKTTFKVMVSIQNVLVFVGSAINLTATVYRPTIYRVYMRTSRRLGGFDLG